MISKGKLVFVMVILVTALTVGCVEQDTVTDNGDENNALPVDEAAESIDEDEISDDIDEEDSEELIETDDLEENDLPQQEEFSSDRSPFQSFNQARENRTPIVLKFYSDT